MLLRRTASAIAVVSLAWASFGGAAAGAGHPTAADGKGEAARTFGEAEKAFAAGDYERAGALFDDVDRMAPHADVAWNAAQSWERAGRPDRAANAYARFLAEAPAGAPDRSRAEAALAELRPTLARVRITLSHGGDDVAVDQQRIATGHVGPRQLFELYVIPGNHVASARVDGAPVSKEVEVPRGAESRLDLVTGCVDCGSEHRGKPLPPWVVVVGAAATLVAFGATVASGLDTLAARREYDTTKNADLLPSGRGKEVRTNVLLSTTLGLGALTAGVGLLLVDWNGKASVDAALLRGGGGITVAARWR